MWYRTIQAQNFTFFTPPADVRFNDALQLYLKNLNDYPDYTAYQISKYETLKEELQNKKLPSGVKPYLVGEKNPNEVARKFYKSISQDTLNKIIEEIDKKINAIKDPTSNIPLNLGLGGTREYLENIGRRDLLEKLDRGNRGSLTKRQAYLFDVDDLINRNKNINLIADTSIQMKPIFTENTLKEVGDLLKDSNIEYANDYLKKYKLKIYIKNDKKYIGSL
jgi:hypothetical protein